MADFAYSRSEMDAAEELTSGGLQSIINFVGGLVSIVLIAGLVAWGWQLLVRDVSGVPVVEALQGPMRVLPDDPGGSQADHQGLAVNRIAEGQEAAPAADRIVLAPAPVELGQSAAPVAPEAATEAAPVTQVAALDVAEPTPAAAPVQQETATDAVVQTAAAANSALIEGLLAEAVASAPRVETVSISIAGVRRSLLPQPRPAALERAAAQAAPATSSAAPAEVDIATLATGTRLVQLGAFDSPEEARSEWTRLAAAYPDFFGPRDRIVQEAVSGGRTFFRLRAHGFADLMDARRFCTALLAEGAPCIPVTVR